VQDVYPIPRIEQILEQLEGKELFMALDICWGYNNIRIKEEDRWKAAFKTQYGLYQPNVMYFGLTNSPTTFQKTMSHFFLITVRYDQGLDCLPILTNIIYMIP
jgi:Reverse transcriptase (RNA-dependent DNA polymerase)